MATITAGEFRNGKVFEMEGKYYQVVEFQHVKPGKGAAFVRTKMKNVVTGGVTETSFNPTAKFEEVAIERKNMRCVPLRQGEHDVHDPVHQGQCLRRRAPQLR